MNVDREGFLVQLPPPDLDPFVVWMVIRGEGCEYWEGVCECYVVHFCCVFACVVTTGVFIVGEKRWVFSHVVTMGVFVVGEKLWVVVKTLSSYVNTQVVIVCIMQVN